MFSRAVIGVCMLLAVSAAYAQNCTTTPAMNRISIAAGNSVIGNATTGTIEVKLAQNFTSQTGYMQIYAAGATWPAGPSSGYSGSYLITSGNGSSDVFVQASSLANPGSFATTFTGQALATGSTTGTTVSDLKVVKVSARKYTVEWSTPGFNSTTNMSYGNDNDTLGLPGGYGYTWPSQDTTTGVSYHSITIDNLIPGGIAAGNGEYPFTVWSECFNAGGTVNPQLYASMPGGNPYSGQAMVTAPVDIVPGQNTFTLATMPGLVQDGIHNGVRAMPGGNVIIPLYWNDTTVPSSGYVHGMNVTVTDWLAGVGLLSNFGASGQYYRGTSLNTWGSNGNFTVTQDNNYSGNLYMHIASNAATAGTGCTSAGGDQMTTDGVSACAYPLKISASPWGGSSCATIIICGPPGSTSTQPFVTKIWVIVYTPPVIPRNPVGPWMNPNTMMPGIPCEREANKGPTIDNCRNLSAGISGVYNNYFSYEGGQQNNCTWNGLVQPIWVNINTSNWFYDGGYVCHTLDLLYPQAGGTNNDAKEHHILGAELEYWYPRRVDYALFASYMVSAPATIIDNPACVAISPSAFLQQCSGMQLSVGSQEVTPIANALAAGTVLRACFNIPTNTVNRPYYTASATSNFASCPVLPRPAVPTLTSVPGGSLPASTTYSLGQYYVAPNGILSFYSGSATITTDPTCPTSGRCSIDVSSLPQVANAIGWCVYAVLSGQSYYQYCTPTSPLTIGTDLVLDGPLGGTSSHPFTNTNIATVTTWGTAGMMITAADTVNHTITVDSRLNNSQPTTSGYAPSQPTTGSSIIVVRAGGIPADAGSSVNQIICASCNFANVVANSTNPTQEADTAYCGVVAGDLNEPIYTTAPNRGSQIISKTTTTLNLLTAINCGPGVPFEIRYRLGHGGASRIFMWTNGFYDVFERQHNFITADAILWLAAAVSPAASGGAPPSNPSFQYSIGLRREDGLTMRACQLSMHVMNELGVGNTPFPPGPMCTYPSPLLPSYWPENAFERIDSFVNNGEGNGTGAGTFLNGITMYSLVQWWLDPLMNAQSDPRYVYWVKKLADFMWPYYEAANARSIPSACNNKYPHEWAYMVDSPRLGINCLAGSNTTATINGNPVWDYWSIYGNLFPSYAFLYWYTGNAPVGTTNANNPGFTYGQAYQDIASWIFVYQANQTFISGPAGMKTLGEMGLWQNQALGWMGGNMGVTPSPLTITTSSLPPATAGTAYSATVVATGGTPPYTWTSSTLPANGLQIDSSGNIGGTPLAAGTTPVTVTVTDAASGTASTSLSIVVNSAPVQPTYPSYITGVIP